MSQTSVLPNNDLAGSASTPSVLDVEPTGKVLVLGSDTRSFLSVVRSLGRKQLSVHVAWYARGSAALRSRYVHEAHSLPAPWESGTEWKAAFSELLRAEQFDLVIPCNDPSLLPLQEHREEFESLARIALPNDRAYRIAFNKQQSAALAAELGVPVARSLIVSDRNQLASAAEQFGFPVVLKPERSYSPARLDRRNRVVRADSQRDLEVYAAEMLGDNATLLVEEFVEGIGAGVEFLADRGELLTAFQHVRLHEPDSGGGSSLRKSVALELHLYEATARLVKHLEYSGVGMVEFRVDPASGRWIFIEINGRFWGSLPLAIACGADFPAYLYDYLVLGRRTFPQTYRPGLRCRNLAKDLSWYREQMSVVMRRPAGAFRMGTSLLGDALATALLRGRSDTFVLDDPRPGIVELGQIVRDVGSRVGRRVSVAVRGARWSRSRQRKRVLRAVRKAARVTFVCKGNICRSPFAERCARGVFPNAEVSSCGYLPRKARPSPENAVAAAREFGVDLDDHRSQVVDAEQIEAADAILVFDEENRETLRTRFPNARRRIHLLGCANARGPLRIADPNGGTLEQFRETYTAIELAIHAIDIDSSGGGSGTQGEQAV